YCSQPRSNMSVGLKTISATGNSSARASITSVPGYASRDVPVAPLAMVKAPSVGQVRSVRGLSGRLGSCRIRSGRTGTKRNERPAAAVPTIVILGELSRQLERWAGGPELGTEPLDL